MASVRWHRSVRVAMAGLAVLIAGCALVEGTALGGSADATALPADTVWMIGDSLAVGASSRLEEQVPATDLVLDAENGRQFRAAPRILERLLDDHPPPDVVVIALGTNGPVSEDDVDLVVGLVGSIRLVFVNVAVPRPWEGSVNEVLSAKAAEFDATIVDWKAVAVGDSSLLRSDGFHLSAAGVDRWVELIGDAVTDR